MEKAGKMIFKKRKKEKSLLQDFSVFNMPICTGNLQAEVRGVIIAASKLLGPVVYRPGAVPTASQ